MKKLLGSTLALAMFAPASVNAELLKNVKAHGALDVQAISARNVADFTTRGTTAAGANDRLGNTHSRVQAGLTWDVLEDVHAKVTLIKGGTQTSGGPRLYGNAPNDLNDVQNDTVVQEALVKIDKMFGHVDTTIGRQFYGEPGDLIVYYGPRDNYGLRTDSLDAFRLDWKGEHMSLTGVAGRTTEPATSLATNAQAAVDLRGLVLACNMHENVKPSAYVYNQVAHATGALGATVGTTGVVTGGRNTNLWVAGLKAKLSMAGFWAHVEAAKNFGEDRTTYAGVTGGAQNVSYKGYALLAKAGYKLDVPNVVMVSPWAEFGYGTGDNNFDYKGNRNFQSINTDYRPGGIYGRFDSTSPETLANGVTGATAAASNGLTNRVIWGFGVKATPAAVAKLTVGASLHRYAFQSVSPTASQGWKPSRNIGTEVDVTAGWKHSDNVMAKVTLGTMQPGGFIRDMKGANASVNPAQMAALDVALKF